MSQRSEKYARSLARRMDELEVEMARTQIKIGGQAMHAEKVASDSAFGIRMLNHRLAAREKREARRADRWRQTTWLAMIALALCAAVALTVKVKADTAPEEKPDAEILATETESASEDYENEKIEVALLEKANVIEDCTVTWYTEDTCGKTPDDPAYHRDSEVEVRDPLRPAEIHPPADS